ncbi:LytR/AlgR family response regulator transcription factor [Pontibacter sp. H249]|uniref:LytR/AlgR family response regulator transcription factor n=1 Tax=Pontibacter sp. H249 TaxID=3133420 RepID=UPI0030BFBFD5
MIRCVVVDDEPMALEVLEDYIRMAPNLTLQQSFSNSLEALAYLQSNEVDLLFLDINMPDLSGIQLLKAVSKPPLVVFTTAYSEYAVKSYELDAVDYLLKPIEFDRFMKAVNKAAEQLQSKSGVVANGATAKDEASVAKDYIFIKSGYQLIKIKLDAILYVEADKNYVSFVTPEKKILALMPLSEVMQMLPPEAFYRIHKSYIVALQHIEAIDRQHVNLHKQQLPIGKTYVADFFKLLNQGI